MSKSANKLYTREDIHAAMIVGVGLGGVGADSIPDDIHPKIAQALDVFDGSHGRDVPNYGIFKELVERQEWRKLAQAHLVSAIMGDGETAVKHAAVGTLAALIDIGAAIDDHSRETVRAST
jgi:hypothetical protein